MADRLDVLIELDRRGALEGEDKAVLDELRRRGAIAPGATSAQRATTQMLDPERMAAESAGPTSAPGSSVLPTLLGIVGSFAGGAAGRATGRAIGYGAEAFMVGGRAVGTGLGSATGEAINPAFLDVQAPTLFDIARTGGLTAVMDLAMTGVFKGVSRGASIRTRPDTPETLEAFEATGVTPKVTDIAQSRRPSVMESTLRQSPAGDIITGATERQAGQIITAKDAFLDRLGPEAGKDAMEAGGRVAGAVEKQIARVREVEDFLWAEQGKMAADVSVNVASAKEAARKIIAEQQKRTEPNKGLIARLQKIVDGPDEVAWDQADVWRKEYGELAGSPMLAADVGQGRAKFMTGALLDDMERAAATSTKPGVAQAYKQVRAFSEKKIDLFRDSEVAKILDTDPEKVVAMLKGSGGASQLQRAKDAILGSPDTGLAMPTPEARESWNIFRRHVMEGAFAKATKETRGASGETLSALQLDKALPDRAALKVLFDDTELKALDQLTTVVKAVGRGERMGANAYTSSTGQVLGTKEMLRLPGQAVGAALGWMAGSTLGPVTGGLGIGAGIKFGGDVSYLLSSNILAKLMTNPETVAYLAGQRTQGVVSRLAATGKWGGEAARWLSQLTTIAVNQDIRDMQRRRAAQ